jgi:hypothetical protein
VREGALYKFSRGAGLCWVLLCVAGSVYPTQQACGIANDQYRGAVALRRAFTKAAAVVGIVAVALRATADVRSGRRQVWVVGGIAFRLVAVVVVVWVAWKLGDPCILT